jgi:poly-gamma-glutamate synthesis protein (capsule biosynthesis protein)
VLQGVEVYQGAPIAYSLGNFVFGGNWNPGDKRTALLELKLKGASYAGHKLYPAFSDKYPEVPVQPYLAEGDAGVGVLRHIENISKPLRGK